MTRNLPVTPGYARQHPLGFRWLWWIGPPALITWLYRTLLPPRLRRLWGLAGQHPTSHLALAAILAGGGWTAFWRYALPSADTDHPGWAATPGPGSKGWN